jgi:hypothetical protein
MPGRGEGCGPGDVDRYCRCGWDAQVGDGALLRNPREIFLRLTAEAWQEWSTCLRRELAMRTNPAALDIARVIAGTLTARGLFCDRLPKRPYTSNATSLWMSYAGTS